jgi:ATP-binding cassette subfamily B (MDR/TAP) protein 1
MSRADDESKAVHASDVVVATPVDLQPKADIEHGNPSYDTPTKEAIEVANVVKEGNDSSPAKKATLGELLQFADSTDTCLMGTGFCMAIISGLNQPAQLIIFGSILDSFNGSTRSSSIKMVSFLALMYLIVAIQMFITNCLQTACMSATSGRQVKRMRDVYFRSLLRQHIAYFDANDQGALATSVMERTLVIQDGLGEKLALGVQFFVSFIAGIAVAFYYVWQLALLMLGVIPVFIILIGIAVSQ